MYWHNVHIDINGPMTLSQSTTRTVQNHVEMDSTLSVSLMYIIVVAMVNPTKTRQDRQMETESSRAGKGKTKNQLSKQPMTVNT